MYIYSLIFIISVLVPSSPRCLLNLEHQVCSEGLFASFTIYIYIYIYISYTVFILVNFCRVYMWREVCDHTEQSLTFPIWQPRRYNDRNMSLKTTEKENESKWVETNMVNYTDQVVLHFKIAYYKLSKF